MPTHEPQRTTKTRGAVVLLVTCIVFLLGVPLFLYTTLIYRAELPVAAVELRAARFSDIVRVQVPVHVTGGLPELSAALQLQIDVRLQSRSGVSPTWRVVMVDSPLGESYEIFVTHEAAADSDFHFAVSEEAREIHVTLREQSTAPLAERLAVFLLEDVFGEELAAVEAILANKASGAAFPYSRVFNVAFNLFVEDGKPVQWDVALATSYIQPALDALLSYCGFRVTSQIQYYSKLHNAPYYDDALSANVIAQNDLSTFINYGEWNLNSHDIAPTINFLVYFSESNYKGMPLLVENSKTNSFLIPQWGGVYIYNSQMPVLKAKGLRLSAADLQPVFDIFASQLFELIGVPKSPKSAIFRIDSFHRIAALKNLKKSSENLSALMKIANSLQGISIPKTTNELVTESLSLFDDAVANLKNASLEKAVSAASQSVDKSDKAFFEKRMVQQVYFPSEHKLAVFLPLLGPICSIVVFGCLKLFAAWKAQRKSAKDAELEKKNE